VIVSNLSNQDDVDFLQCTPSWGKIMPREFNLNLKNSNDLGFKRISDKVVGMALNGVLIYSATTELSVDAVTPISNEDQNRTNDGRHNRPR